MGSQGSRGRVTLTTSSGGYSDSRAEPHMNMRWKPSPKRTPTTIASKRWSSRQHRLAPRATRAPVNNPSHNVRLLLAGVRRVHALGEVNIVQCRKGYKNAQKKYTYSQ